MAIKAVFVGVNKHRDPAMLELGGARQDATALWALFADTLQGDLSSRLLVDEAATHAEVSQSLLGVLDSASSDDVVLIAFAGHGTPEGHLVMYDTDGGDLPGTALPMSVLAEAFRNSQARSILCVLDCCFSGQAPARVLEGVARARSAFAFNGIYGEGRILLAACATNESAYEQPGSGHGLLTLAIIEAMTTETENVSFPEVAGEIIRLARVAAERIGITQTPVFLGTVQGGLVFPSLKRGENFHAAFPATPVARMSGAFADFIAHGFPQEIIDQWSSRFPLGLNKLQIKAVNEYGVLAGKPLFVIAPTSSGKTLIGELAAVQAVSAGKKAAFLLPYRALVNEKFDEFMERYSPAGLRIVRCSGDATDGVAPVLAGRYDIGFFTYEMFLNMALGAPRLLNQLGLVVLDEGQFITDPRRGITVELILALLIRARERGIDPQLLVLSAVIGNLNHFDRWLGLDVLVSRERPVPLIEGVLDRRGTFQFQDVDGSVKTQALLASHVVVQRREQPSMQDVIVPLVKQLVAAQEKVIIFRNQRGSAQGCARYLAAELGLPQAVTVLNALPTQDLTVSSQDLRACLMGGTAFHSSNLLRAEREAVEKGFRSSNGEIFALASTTTLAAGINTPASTVVLAENEFIGEDGRPFTVAEYKNMAGRAGRLGFNETGKAIILAETALERAQLFQKYVLGIPENVVSSFEHRDLPTWTLRLLSQVRGVRAEDIPTLLVNTFGGYSASRANPQWLVLVQRDIAQFVNRLLHAGMAEPQGDLIHLTLLGRACGASSLSFESAIRLVELMKGLAASTSPIQVLALVQVLDELDSTYTPIVKRNRSEQARVSEAADRYGYDVVSVLQRYCREPHEYWARCKRAAVLFDWIEGVAVEEIERRYTKPFGGQISYGNVIGIADATRFHLRSAYRILEALFPDRPKFLQGLDGVLLQLEYGLPAHAMGLVQLRVPMTRGQYLALAESGCLNRDDLDKLSESQLIACVGTLTASLLRPVRPSVVGSVA